MKIFALAATGLFATVAYASPASVEARNSGVVCTFSAATVSFTQWFPTDGSVQKINNNLSVSSIRCGGGDTCTFHGIDGSVTIVVGTTPKDVGPPQTQVSGSCVPSK
ncbi:hypothetical protein MMC31_003152 [Peltigera leucophlebia]|nr:hypothetical protein [Peltigera leucophlebia]